SLVAVTAQLAFRLAYYGDFVPNTAHVKAELDPASFGAGLDYVLGALLAMPGLAITASALAVVALVNRRTRALAPVLLLPVLAWFGYLTAIGGDHFPGHRLLHGVLAPLALLAGLGAHALPRTWLLTAAVATLAAVAAGVDVWTARHHPQSREARGEHWEWHGEVLGEVLHRAFGERRPLLAVDAAGALPFYSRLPALDMLGLCDRTIATTPFPDWLDTVRPEIPKPPGHLRGNGAYVMDRQPDLITFQHPPGLPLPVFVSACEFEDDPRFLDGYRLVLLDLGTPELRSGQREPHLASLWVRVDGRVGVQRGDGELTVPAYLFGAFRLDGPAIGKH
ncbi:MAG: hypothetical protein KAI24_23460, partial [Planctomycetes bacterium]|nr:hypothetical protein [Planctomycetota bacterium]